MISSESHKYDKYIADGHGARWAAADEIKSDSYRLDLQAEKYPVAGIPLLSDGKTAYVDADDRHAIIWGSTGSKKTRLFVLPLTNICIRAGESFVVMDPKGEIYRNSTNNARENGYQVVVLNLRDLGHGDQWNPLSVPYHLYRAGKIDEAANMVNDFVKVLLGNRINEKDVMWSQLASSYITAHMLFLFGQEDERIVNMKSVARMCAEDVVPDLQALIKTLPVNSQEATTYNVILNINDRTRTSATSYAYSMVSMFNAQQQLASALSKTTFSMEDMADKKTAIYLIVPDEKDTYHFLGSLFVKQLYEAMISAAQKTKDGKLPIRMNYILDEFCNMPTIPDMVSMITAARSRNMRFYLFVQGMHQLLGKYDRDAETIKGNCDNWFFLNSREYALLQEISQLCGTRKKGGVEEALISTSQLQHLNKEKGECVVFYHRNYPFVSQLADISEYRMFDNPCTERVYGKAFKSDCAVVDLKLLKKQRGVEGDGLPRRVSAAEMEEKRKAKIEMIRKLVEDGKKDS